MVNNEARDIISFVENFLIKLAPNRKEQQRELIAPATQHVARYYLFAGKTNWGRLKALFSRYIFTGRGDKWRARFRNDLWSSGCIATSEAADKAADFIAIISTPLNLSRCSERC